MSEMMPERTRVFPHARAMTQQRACEPALPSERARPFPRRQTQVRVSESAYGTAPAQRHAAAPPCRRQASRRLAPPGQARGREESSSGFGHHDTAIPDRTKLSNPRVRSRRRTRAISSGAAFAPWPAARVGRRDRLADPAGGWRSGPRSAQPAALQRSARGSSSVPMARQCPRAGTRDQPGRFEGGQSRRNPQGHRHT